MNFFSVASEKKDLSRTTCLMYIAVKPILRLVISEGDVMNFYRYDSHISCYAVMGNEIWSDSAWYILRYVVLVIVQKLVEMPSLHTWNEAKQERCSVYI